MPKVCAKESLLIGASPDKVYRVLLDPAHHKRILPDAFVRYEAENDAIVSFAIKVGGITREFRVEVQEIEKDRLLREKDLSTGIETDFRLERHEQGTLVTISTSYEAPANITGIIEAFTAPKFLSKLYNEELIKLGRYILTIPE